MKVPGFKAAAVGADLRYRGRLDLGLIVADTVVDAAGVFTRNRVQAAPVLWSKEKAVQGRARAVLVNSGQANACTGPEGLKRARRSAQAVAARLNCSPDEVLLASTGVIGQPLNIAGIEKALPALVSGLDEENLPLVAQAMMTTDTKPKIIQAQGRIQGRPFTVVGLAKGAGMICPNMATMLSFILTDAKVNAPLLQVILQKAAEKTFNRITVDGDTSTNDCVLALAGGPAARPVLDSDDSPGRENFEQVLTGVMAELARMIAADGEGATKLVRVVVSGATDESQAKAAAMTVANSPLVKTAWFGQDANWGRIMGALGRSGAVFDPNRVDIFVDDVPLVKNGLDAGQEAAAAAVMRRPEFSVKIELRAGTASAEVLTCDLSIDYVKINADYRS